VPFRTLSKFKALLILDSMDIIVQLRAFAGFMISNTKVLIGVSLENSFLRMLRSLGWSIVNFEGNKQIWKEAASSDLCERKCITLQKTDSIANIYNYDLNFTFRRQVVVTVQTALSFCFKQATKRLQLKQKTASKLKPSLP